MTTPAFTPKTMPHELSVIPLMPMAGLSDELPIGAVGTTSATLTQPSPGVESALFESATLEAAGTSHQLALEALLTALSARDPSSPLAALWPALLALAQTARNDAMNLLAVSGATSFACDPLDSGRGAGLQEDGALQTEQHEAAEEEALRRAA